MSVINKMLRDLDKRNAPDEPQARPGTPALRAGVASVAVRQGNDLPAVASQGPLTNRTRLLVAGGLGAAVALALAGWLSAGKGGGAATPQSAVVAVPEAKDALPAPAPAPATPASAANITPLAAAVALASSAPTALEPGPQKAVGSVAATVVPTPQSKATSAPPSGKPDGKAKIVVQPANSTGAVAPEPARASAPAGSTGIAQPAGAGPATASSPTVTHAETKAPGTASGKAPAQTLAAPATPLDATALAIRQQQAARDTLAQAQSLWNTGSRDGAIDVLQQAVASAERSTAATPANRPQLLMLVRELSRMLLADGRAQAAWDVLTRLEPLLGAEADLLAVRANAAQRLGRHQDSVLAYTAALQARPLEQRWMLGAAVSLAALGQTAKATEMAERARQAGPIAKEVQAYLRQAGVVLPEP